jgi:1,4-alpha-glucan branching enzyme
MGSDPTPRSRPDPGAGRQLTSRAQSGGHGWFPATLDDLDLRLIAQGNHLRLYDKLGAHRREFAGVTGISFALWAPNADAVRVVGQHRDGTELSLTMRKLEPGGVWEAFGAEVPDGATYAYEVTTAAGVVTKADPLAFATAPPPATTSVVFSSRYTFEDQEWIERRQQWDSAVSPLSIYEVHLGSWRRQSDGRSFSYRELASTLPDYVVEMGFTHVEFLPVAEHPFRGSWGYQTTSYFAPTARFGNPDDFRFLVDALHRAGVGVIVDWVPAHFPKDPWALARFDGTPLYEDADPQKGQHPDWGTLVFDYARPQVRNFLIASTMFWAERFHIDGFRVDAVASMLYLDYSRKKGEWKPNRLGGRDNLEAVAFITELTEKLHADHPDVMIIGEESGAWPGVTKAVRDGGLGFDFKWNLGWMHDTLEHFSRAPERRRHHGDDLTFTLMYAWSERYILPLSHDEVVHEKKSLLNKMPGDRNERFASLKAMLAYMWAYPGKQLLFMGGELAQEREWNHDSALEWDLLDDPAHAGVQRLVRDLNRLYRATPALWARDASPDGCRWTAQDDAHNSIVTFFRTGDSQAEHLVCVCNLAPVLHRSFRIGLPTQGPFREVLNTDAEAYGGRDTTNPGPIQAAAYPAQAQPYSAPLTLPPLTTIWLQT